MSEENYNIAIIGQTGAGKSSLLNFLFDKDAPTGTGEPVTESGFHEYECLIKTPDQDHINVNVYDSWGLEVGKHEEWNMMFRKELETRGVDKSPKDWFHCVIYCLSGASNRVQDADIDIINEALSHEYPVTIALTKADTLSEEDEEKLISALRSSLSGSQDRITIVPVCSVTKKTRIGTTEAFGKEDFENAILKQTLEAMSQRLPHCVEQRLMSRIADWKSTQISRIDNETGYTNEKEIAKSIEESTTSLKSTLEEIKKQTIASVLKSYQRLPLSNEENERLRIDFAETVGPQGVWEKLLFSITASFLIIPAIGWVLYSGKDENKKQLREGVSKITESLEKWVAIEKQELERGILKMAQGSRI